MANQSSDNLQTNRNVTYNPSCMRHLPVCKSCCNSVSQVKVDGTYDKMHKSDSFTADENGKSLIVN